MAENNGTYTLTPADALALGWSIIPTNRNKMPMLDAWKAYQERKPTSQELEKWMKWNPPAWAVITGAISARITLDFDGEKGQQTFQTLHIEAHRRTPAGGYHADFIHPGWRVASLNGKSKIKLGERWPGMDIRADGGYALFAGQTERGKYIWLRDPKPHPLDILPLELRQFLGLLKNPATAPVQIDSEDLLQAAIKRIPTNGRNGSGFWLATQLRDNNYSQSTAQYILESYRAQCPATNAKGEAEEYTQAEMMASLDQAYARPAREPWAAPKKTAAMPPTDIPDPPEPPPPGEAQQSKPKHFVLTDGAVKYCDDETGSKTFVCSRLDVVAFARDPNSESWGRWLKWNDAAGKPHSWIVPMRMLVGDGLSFHETLADGGLEIGTGPKTNHLLAQYVRQERPSRYIICVPYVGWLDQCFVFPECVIPHQSNAGYQSTGRGEHFYRTRGTLESWKENIGKRCAKNSRLVFSISAAFAGPLLRPLNVQGGGFHLRSTSSMGKSTAQWVAGSVWGGGGRNGFARTWAATKNAIESIAELHNDGCLILDEIRMIDPREVEQVIYMLANGSGKARETRNMTGRRTLQWLCIILSSGEIPLADCAALAGQRIKGGAEIRMVTIPADANRGMGLFEELHGIDNPRLFAETLEAASKEHYGTPIREFLESLICNWDHIIEEARLFIEEFISEYLPEGAASEIRRVLRRFALVAAAGELASEFGITGWEETEAQKAAKRCFEDWIQQRGGVEATDVQNAIEQIRGILASQHSRFRPAEPPINPATKEIIPQPVIQNSLGYWKVIEGELVYLVGQEAFKNELCKGFDPRDVAGELHKRQYLLKNDTDRNLGYKCEVTLPTGDTKRLRFYAIHASILEEILSG